MRPTPPGDRQGDPDDAERIARDYETLWESGRPDLERYWSGVGDARSLLLLGVLIKVDLQNRFEAGERPTVAEYLARFPELEASGDRVVSLVYEEFCLLEEAGERPDSDVFIGRYGAWADSLHSQLVYHRELSRVVGVESKPVVYPKPGDRFATYRLRSVLGVGGAARVYLATDDGLGGRKVALKVSASVGREPSILANLDHRNIVPILTVAESEDGLRGFCMPYRPGVTLEELIHRLGREKLPRKARDVWDALKPTDSTDLEAVESERTGWSDFPAKGTYPEAIAWIGLALANALAYLHGHDVLHRDIKPANVLLAYREGPQLLDFNLAHAPNAPEHAHAALKGGTLPFMAPEQLLAFLEPERWDDVGTSADIYALGLVLRCLITGQPPDHPNPNLPLPRAIRTLHDRRSEPPTPVRKYNPGVPPALESILDRCLAVDPAGRYATAADLAEDLARFLARRPLKFASNTSWAERAANFAHRNRLLIAGTAILLLTFQAALRVPGPSLRDDPEFRRGVERLAAPDPASWTQARDDFERLTHAYPKSAWPRVYQAVAIEKLSTLPGRKSLLGEVNERLAEALLLPDFDEAMTGRLAEDSKSITLLTLQGNLLLKMKSDPSRFDKAYPILTRALELDPDRFEALKSVAEVERNTQRPEDAIRHLRHAIRLGGSNSSFDPSAVVACRLSLLPIQARLADHRLDHGRTAEERRSAAEVYNDLEASLAGLVSQWEGWPAKQLDYFRNFYGACLTCGRAALVADAGDRDAAREGFARARGFYEALVKDHMRDPDGGRAIHAEVDPKLIELEQRARRFLGPRPAAEVQPHSSD